MAHIHVLPPETSRLIAAGEVIDRPASALRELLDNAIDAGASEIQVRIEKGGIDLIQVVDNGGGMSREDLELSIAEHATSKIEKALDLLSVSTLGFRGEALASIASVADLEITSREAGSDIGWQLVVDSGKTPSLKPTASRHGTAVRVQSLFAQYPARRQFLKRPMSEALLCHAIFVERALAFPSIGFSWTSAGTMESYSSGTLEQRFCLLYPEVPAALVSRFDAELEQGSFTLLFADPSFHRKDRRYLQIFVNGRKVPEWGLSGVLEYAFSGYLPGGMRPCAFLFASIPPAQADFNIHPAKREVRIKNIEAFKSAVYASVQPHLRQVFGAGPSNMEQSAGIAPRTTGLFPHEAAQSGYQATPRAFWDALQEESKESRQEERRSGVSTESPTPATPGPFRYIGRAFGPFLLFEKDAVLYILDQHAAHERILYDGLVESQHPSQALLVPYVLEFPSGEMRKQFLENRAELERIGFRFEMENDSCIINEVPALLGEKAVQSLTESFFSESVEEKKSGGGPHTDMLATLACRAAIKDGDVLDQAAACNLIGRALRLPFPRCPHGRPIWIALDRNALYRMVGRLVG
ncbi:MAG: DNA mismatch repair endonuclease MutL [Spirochaetaceae bacterium]|nr:DNA mismatch repair endonuclease MutL [Spirochaetaceae bacterium]